MPLREDTIRFSSPVFHQPTGSLCKFRRMTHSHHRVSDPYKIVVTILATSNSVVNIFFAFLSLFYYKNGEGRVIYPVFEGQVDDRKAAVVERGYEFEYPIALLIAVIAPVIHAKAHDAARL